MRIYTETHLLHYNLSCSISKEISFLTGKNLYLNYFCQFETLDIIIQYLTILWQRLKASFDKWWLKKAYHIKVQLNAQHQNFTHTSSQMTDINCRNKEKVSAHKGNGDTVPLCVFHFCPWKGHCISCHIRSQAPTLINESKLFILLTFIYREQGEKL